jgi:hypothetical protein
MNFFQQSMTFSPKRHILHLAWAAGQFAVLAAVVASHDVHATPGSEPFGAGTGAAAEATAPVVRWTRCAAEGATCEVPSSTRVRYGANGKYVVRTVNGGVSCTNMVFGDPDPGVEKGCEYASAPATKAAALARRSVATDAIFAPTSFWYQPIPKTASLHPNSRAYVTEFLRQKAAYYGTVSVGANTYASPVYVAPAGAATRAVKVWDCQNKGNSSPELARQWAQVPIPDNARASSGTDGEMTILQPSTDTIWEFWQMKKNGAGWQACWGGRMTNISKTNGIWPHPYGTTATGLPFLGGQVTAEELARGEIRHVIGISLVDLEKASVFSWPATRSDGANPDNAPNRIPAGTRFRLDPAVDVDALHMSAAGKVIARAAQIYGFVVWDRSGSLGIRAQNPRSYIAQGQPDPYPTLFNGKAEWAVLEGFPWGKLQFLPKDYGKP